MMMRRTKKCRVFIEEYLRCWNATKAARIAGYAHPNKQGPRLLVDVGIAAEIETRIAEKAMRADEVVARLGEHGRSEWTQYLDASGNLEIKRLIADGKGHLIKGMKQTQWGRLIEFYDGQAALVHLGKVHGIFVDKKEVEHSGILQVEFVNDWRKVKSE